MLAYLVVSGALDGELPPEPAPVVPDPADASVASPSQPAEEPVAEAPPPEPPPATETPTPEPESADNLDAPAD